MCWTLYRNFAKLDLIQLSFNKYCTYKDSLSARHCSRQEESNKPEERGPALTCVFTCESWRAIPPQGPGPAFLPPPAPQYFKSPQIYWLHLDR